jgi:2-methylcitrate dehydratase PrpD
MRRRDFCKSIVMTAAYSSMLAGADTAPQPKASGRNTAPLLTRTLSEFVARTKFPDIPPDVFELAKKSNLYGLGQALSGSVSDAAAIMRKYIEQMGPTQGDLAYSTVVGTSLCTSAPFAALCNGVSIHINDYDDSMLVADDVVHATVPTLPPSLALAEQSNHSGQDLLLAYILGVEVESKIAASMSPQHYREGFHATGTIGPFGSTAAAAKLLGLTAPQIECAFGLVAAQAAGLRDNFGTMTKPYQAGHAAENGVVAATLAKLGWTAATDILEAPRGFLSAMGGTYEADPIIAHLGNPWSFQSPGALIKHFPCGTIQQPVMDLILQLRSEHNIQPADVEKVSVAGSKLDVDTLFRHQPKTGLEAKFSMEFCISVLLVDGKAGLAEFSDATVTRPEIQAMIRRVSFTEGQQVASTADAPVEIHLKSGQIISGHTRAAKGSPTNPMTYQEVAEKFSSCGALAKWPGEKLNNVQKIVLNLDRQTDLHPLTAALRP